jgi:hypothetical protein
MVHTVTVWHWDGKEEKAQKRTLVITQSEKIKSEQLTSPPNKMLDNFYNLLNLVCLV